MTEDNDQMLAPPKIESRSENLIIYMPEALFCDSGSSASIHLIEPNTKKPKTEHNAITVIPRTADEIASDLFFGRNYEIVLRKVPTQEIDVYEAIPGCFKHFFPTLLNFSEEKNEDGDDVHVFTLEKLEPFILEKGGYNAFFRMETFEEYLLEAATMAVHVLFGLLILHEKAGYVHGDISPNNIMFSPQFNIWKIIDFNLSLPVEESLKRSRRCGTDGYKAPESIRTGIYSPSSDVYSFGMVLETCICPYLAQYIITSHQPDELREFENLVSQLTRKNPAERLTVRAALAKFIKFVCCHPVNDFTVYGSTLLFPTARAQLKANEEKTD